MSQLSGNHFVAGKAEPGSGASFHALDATTGSELQPGYFEASTGQVRQACDAARDAAVVYAATEPEQRSALLRAIADGLMDLGEVLVKRVCQETALPAGRVEGERGRTVLQLRQFADLVEEGSWVDARIDHADPDRAPMPKPDLRRMSVGLGPVVVFGASNFPLAYSVAGGDTASALAAGCPVIVKGHPAHPGTSELVGGVISEAVARLGLPAGTFSLLHSQQYEVGSALVRHPAIKAVGFTGSHQGGRALCDLAAARTEPIPVFAEMGSANPLVVLPKALAVRGGQIAGQVAASALLAQGQFCTSPGFVIWLKGDGSDEFVATLREQLGNASGGPTVHPSIRDAYERALEEVRALPVDVTMGQPVEGGVDVCPAMLQASPQAVLEHARLRCEIYGPAVLAIACDSADQMEEVVASLEGHLTATVHGDDDDFANHGRVVDGLRQKVGRLIANGVPTGVEVSAAMVHGGPYPASTDARFTAVGISSIQRWVRPVCWQDWPHDQLPLPLRNENPCGIRRWVDGSYQAPTL